MFKIFVVLRFYLLIAVLLSSSAYADAQTFRKIFGTDDNCVDGFATTDTSGDVHIGSAVAVAGYWGDPGTYEREQAVAYNVTWNVESILNMPTPTRKLGFYDYGLPRGSSAVVLKCQEAGFLVNTFQFSHTQPVQGGGRSGQLAKKSVMPLPMFTSPQNDLIIQGFIKHPSHYWVENDSSGQIILFYYIQPLNCPSSPGGLCPAATLANQIPSFAHVIGIYDSLNPNGTYTEFYGNDTFTGFYSSPLADFQLNGQPPAYLHKSQYSSPMATKTETWSDARFFRAEISYSKMALMISQFRNSQPSVAATTSASPSDWGIVLVGGITEIAAAPGPQCTTNNNALGCKDVAMAVTFANVDAYERSGGTNYATIGPEIAKSNLIPGGNVGRGISSEGMLKGNFSLEKAKSLLK